MVVAVAGMVKVVKKNDSEAKWFEKKRRDRFDFEDRTDTALEDEIAGIEVEIDAVRINFVDFVLIAAELTVAKLLDSWTANSAEYGALEDRTSYYRPDTPHSSC